MNEIQKDAQNHETAVPVWASGLRSSMETMADELKGQLTGWMGNERIVSPEAFGYTSGGTATSAIQAAIDYLADLGGGTVKLEKGDYVSGTIELRSNIRLEITKGARILGNTDLRDYPERIAKRRTVMDTHMGMHQSLIFAEGCNNISICGKGIIDGRGGRENFPGEETICGTPGRPFLLRIIDCTNVHINGICLKDAACWMQNYLNCENLLIEKICVENQANYNNDGIDIDGCRNVIVRDCYVSSGDDAMCFKGASQKSSERILVENCEFYTSCNAVKFGTDTQGDFRNVLIRHCKVGGVAEEMRHIKAVGADSGVSLEMVDGGTLENILISDIEIDRSRSPLFMRLDNRGRVKPGDPRPDMGTICNIILENITGSENGPVGSYFLGIPEKRIKNVFLHNVKLYQEGSEKPAVQETDFGEMYGWYPDAQMIKNVGDAPAYGLWVKYMEGLTLMDYQVIPVSEEKRPWIVAGIGVKDLQIK